MAKFFNPDSPLMRFMTKVADLMILNILFLVTCLPIFTVGAAWTALHAVTLKMVRDQEGAIAKSYFRAFCQNFRQSTWIWLAALALGFVLLLDIRFLNSLDTALAQGLKLAVQVIGIAAFAVGQYLFPLIAKFEASTSAYVKNACLMALAYLPKTALMTMAAVGAVMISLWNNLTISIAIAFWPMIGFALLAFGNSGILEKIFNNFYQKSP